MLLYAPAAHWIGPVVVVVEPVLVEEVLFVDELVDVVVVVLVEEPEFVPVVELVVEPVVCEPPAPPSPPAPVVAAPPPLPPAPSSGPAPPAEQAARTTASATKPKKDREAMGARIARARGAKKWPVDRLGKLPGLVGELRAQKAARPRSRGIRASPSRRLSSGYARWSIRCSW
jgi:hypothetical protein